MVIRLLTPTNQRRLYSIFAAHRKTGWECLRSFAVGDVRLFAASFLPKHTANHAAFVHRDRAAEFVKDHGLRVDAEGM